MILLSRLALALGLLVVVGCDGDDDDGKPSQGCVGGGAGDGGAAGAKAGCVGPSAGGSSSGDGYVTSGCLTEESCVTTHAPLTPKQVTDSEAACTGTILKEETCPRSAGRGCCISGAAGVRITTCVYKDPQEALQKGCADQGGTWTTSL